MIENFHDYKIFISGCSLSRRRLQAKSICQPYEHVFHMNQHLITLISPVTLHSLHGIDSYLMAARPNDRDGATSSLPGQEDGNLPQIPLNQYTSVLTYPRRLPRLQILPLPQPQPSLPHQPGMLPQDVRILRRPALQLGPGPVPRSRLRAHPPQSPLPETSLRHDGDGARDRHPRAGREGVYDARGGF